MTTWHHNSDRVQQVVARLSSGWVAAACLSGESKPRVVFPGSFNPLHTGHRRMADAAGRRLRSPVHFEMSLVNVDKPTLSAPAVIERCQNFDSHDTVWLTRAATFAEKSRLFPGAWFVVGVDTVQRLIDPKYYGDQADRRDLELAKIVKKECQFLVFGRLVNDRFVSLSDLRLPAPLADYCVEVPEDDFREDVSSSELRAPRN